MSALPARERAAAAEGAPDAALVAAIMNDDLGALGALYDRHAVHVWRVVHRVTNGASDVEDIVHATFLKVPQLASSFDGRASARSWLIGIGVRLALRHARSAARFARMLTRFGHATRAAELVDPEAHAAGRARIATLDRALSKLSAPKRVVFILVEMEGLSAEEVARELGIPVPTVRTRLFHAKNALRAALAAREAR